MFKSVLAVAVLAVSAHAGAATIDFEGIPDGAAPGDYYLETYGVRFTGGVVRYNALGAYLTGYTRMTFAPGAAGIGLSMLANSFTEDARSMVCGDFCETVQIPTSHIPSGAPPNPRVFGEGTLFGTLLPDAYNMSSISFATTGLDNIVFNSLTRQADRIDPPAALPAAGNVTTGEVPLPGTAWLLGAGMLALLGRRRK